MSRALLIIFPALLVLSLVASMPQSAMAAGSCAISGTVTMEARGLNAPSQLAFRFCVDEGGKDRGSTWLINGVPAIACPSLSLQLAGQGQINNFQSSALTYLVGGHRNRDNLFYVDVVTRSPGHICGSIGLKSIPQARR